MKIVTNTYYETILNDMLSQLKSSRPGKRRWILDPITGLPDFSSTERSTFPDWSKFFYSKPSKRERLYLLQNNLKAIDLGYFNGNTRGLTNIISKALTGSLKPLTPRQIKAFDIIIIGFIDYMKEYDAKYGESYMF